MALLSHSHKNKPKIPSILNISATPAPFKCRCAHLRECPSRVVMAPFYVPSQMMAYHYLNISAKTLPNADNNVTPKLLPFLTCVETTPPSQCA
jgi:hypothetical protein